MVEAEIKTVDTLLDKGVRVAIPAPFFLRLFRKRSITVNVKRPVLGNMLRISKLYLQMKVEANENDLGGWIKTLETCAVPVSRICAIGMLRGRYSGWLFTKPLARYLRWNMTTRDLANLAAILVSLSGYQDFTNTIKLLGLMRMTQPKNLSQE
jgi:hypothetical protein